MMDEKTINFLRNMKDKKIASLLRGIYNFFDLKFPSGNYNTSPCINEQGYHMIYRDVEYSFSFYYNNNMNFKLRADVRNGKNNLEQKLNEVKIVNKHLDETKYLADKKIKFSDDSIDVICRIKKIPENQQDINLLCSQLWGYIIKGVFHV